MKKVLLIDDESIVVKMYQRIFVEENDFDYKFAINGEEGLALMRREKPDLVLLDILMPKVDGIQVLKKMREDEDLKYIPVLMLTNVDDQSRMADAVSLGARGYLVKSDYKPDEVMQKVNEILN